MQLLERRPERSAAFPLVMKSVSHWWAGKLGEARTVITQHPAGDEGSLSKHPALISDIVPSRSCVPVVTLSRFQPERPSPPVGRASPGRPSEWQTCAATFWWRFPSRLPPCSPGGAGRETRTALTRADSEHFLLTSALLLLTTRRFKRICPGTVYAPPPRPLDVVKAGSGTSLKI